MTPGFGPGSSLSFKSMIPSVRVNQVGYLPDGPKNATVVSEADEPLPWVLRDAAGESVASGQSTPRGEDAASGQRVHTVDFSAVRASGAGFTLAVAGDTSYPFAIAGDIYRPLRADALRFFYIQRSGIAIDGALVGSRYARPAGHVGVPPNRGDLDVPYEDYSLDVRGGWYDAGDHGKYVVNGGIATYQLLSAYERTTVARVVEAGALEDGTLRVPERGNGVPDILDEARWELEFLLRMQVPPGLPLAGMAHHKVHDRDWTGVPMRPEDDPEPRVLRPPSTAATLNLAAAAAQGSRLFARYDTVFATRLLAAARTAWDAALAHPDRYAPADDSVGGGPYDDTDVSDEFYWAAVELYLTTGEQPYLSALAASPHHTGDVFAPNGFSWDTVAALGRLDLATLPAPRAEGIARKGSGLSTGERARIRTSVVAAAEMFLAVIAEEPYGLPLSGTGGGYVWGSNSNIVNNAIVLATAYDLTGDPRYRDGVLQGMDYIFGRNALNVSYVTGYGTRYPGHPHNRTFAHEPPVGVLVGGANANLQDPYAAEHLAGARPQFCYVDHIDSFSTNDATINWNSALAWIASFLADMGTASGRSATGP